MNCDAQAMDTRLTIKSLCKRAMCAFAGQVNAMWTIHFQFFFKPRAFLAEDAKSRLTIKITDPSKL